LIADMTGVVALTRDEQLQLTVKRIFRSEGVPPFEKHAREVYVRALDSGGTSAQLTRIVLKDLGLTAQILRLANSSFYNRSGRSIMSVAHAITLLGWDTVRQLVNGLRYIEHFARHSPGVRELIVSSLISAAQAREIAVRIGYSGPEDAYIAALFRNLGEVLVACYHPREYCEIILAAKAENIDCGTACIQVLDYSWDELAAQVAESWNLPATVRMCLDGSGMTAKSANLRSLASIVGYSHQLTEALYRNGAPLESFHLRTILDANGRSALITVRDLRGAVDCALDSARHTLTSLGIPVDSLQIDAQAERAHALLESDYSLPDDCVERVRCELGQVGESVTAGELDLSTALAAVLKVVADAGMDRTLFALLSEDRQWLRGRLCDGPDPDELLAGFQFPIPKADGPILAAMVREQDVFIDCSRDARYNNSRLVRNLRPRGFALLPVIVDGLTAGCLYADVTQSGGLQAARPVLTAARDLISEIIGRTKRSDINR
jgi:HD-like signal output (HDOD) protein